MSKLGTLGLPEAVEALKNALRDSTAEVAREAAVAQASDRTPATVATLAAVAENRDGYFLNSVRLAAAIALSGIGTDTAKEFIRSVLANPNEAPEIRQALDSKAL